MKVKDLVSVYHDSVVIYEAIDIGNAEYKDLYIGDKDGISPELLECEVGEFWASKENVIQIRIERN